MVLAVDHTANIDRIIDIIEDNDNFSNDDDPGRRLRKINFAESDKNVIDDSTPYCYVQVPQKFQFTREDIGTKESDFFQQLVEYHIVIVARAKDQKKVWQDEFFFVDEMIKTFRANPRCGKPGDITTDPKFIRSNILRIERFQPVQGQELDAVRIVLQAQVGTAWEFELPSSTLTLPLISKPLDTEGIQSNTNLLDDGTIVVTKISDPGILDVEFESSSVIDTTIDALITAGLEITANIRKGGSILRARTVVLIERRKPIPFDHIEKTVLSMIVIS